MHPTTKMMSELAARYHGKLLLRSEIPLSEHTFQELLKQGYFHPYPPLQKTFLGMRCMRCQNKKKSLFATFPCYSCSESHYYCRKCIEMGRILECTSLYYWRGATPTYPKQNHPCTWDGSLSKYQQLASDRIVQTVRKGKKELLVWGVCGAGKTEMLFSGLSEAIRTGKRICIATPRQDVVRELVPRLKDSFPNTTLQALYGGSKDKEATAQIIVSTTHQLLRFQEAFDLMIIDEVDAFPYHKDPSLPIATKRATKKFGTTIYLTATPRNQQKILLKLNRLPHVFVPVRYHGYPLPIPQLKQCFSLKNDLGHPRIPLQFMNWLKNRQNKRRQILVFLPTISLGEKLIGPFTQICLQNQWIHKKTEIDFVHADDSFRKEKIILFRKREIKILLTTTILERGVTFPSVDVIVLDAGHEVFDEAALVQIAGRAGRDKNDPTGEVIFYHDGKTNAMVQAIQSIKKMNRRGGFPS